MAKNTAYTIIFCLLISLVLVQISCVNKSQATQPKNQLALEGLYIGTYLFDQGIADANAEPQYFSFIIKPGGELSVESVANRQDYYARGKWKIEGSKILFQYRYTSSVTGEELEQIATADWSAQGKLENGVWYNRYTPTMKGSFYMTKVY